MPFIQSTILDSRNYTVCICHNNPFPFIEIKSVCEVLCCHPMPRSWGPRIEPQSSLICTQCTPNRNARARTRQLSRVPSALFVHKTRVENTHTYWTRPRACLTKASGPQHVVVVVVVRVAVAAAICLELATRRSRQSCMF